MPGLLNFDYLHFISQMYSRIPSRHQKISIAFTVAYEAAAKSAFYLKHTTTTTTTIESSPNVLQIRY